MNTGILLIVVSANLSEHTNFPLVNYLQGTFYDYAPQWYISVGYLLIKA